MQAQRGIPNAYGVARCRKRDSSMLRKYISKSSAIGIAFVKKDSRNSRRLLAMVARFISSRPIGCGDASRNDRNSLQKFAPPHGALPFDLVVSAARADTGRVR